ncbi:MAG TPA: ABC transporter permease [Povalibacter sp.]|nr:ABC transporter permease [Povalibacter sp.]
MRIPLFAMIRKDLQVYLTDRRAVIMTIIAPIVIASFFGYVFAGASRRDEPAKIAVSIVDEDGSSVARAIVSGAEKDRNLKLSEQTRAQATEAVRKGSVSVAMIIPHGFGDAAARALFSGRSRPDLTVLYDPSHAAEMGMVSGIMTQYIMQSVSAEAFSGDSASRVAEESLQQLAASGMPPEQREKLRNLILSVQSYYAGAPPAGEAKDHVPGLAMPYNVSEHAVTSGEDVAYNGYAHAFAGMTVQFVLIAAVDLGIGILNERQRGLWKRLRSAPISRRLLLAGKAASGSLIGLLSLLISFTFAIVVFGVRIHGSIVGFLAVAAASAIMATTFGILIASLGRTPQGVRGVSMLAVLVMLMLGGAWMPAFLFPAWLQQLTFVVPTRWAIDGLEAMTWRGLDLSAGLVSSAALLGFAALFSLLSLWRFRWEE